MHGGIVQDWVDFSKELIQWWRCITHIIYTYNFLQTGFAFDLWPSVKSKFWPSEGKSFSRPDVKNLNKETDKCSIEYDDCTFWENCPNSFVFTVTILTEVCNVNGLGRIYRCYGYKLLTSKPVCWAIMTVFSSTEACSEVLVCCGLSSATTSQSSKTTTGRTSELQRWIYFVKMKFPLAAVTP